MKQTLLSLGLTLALGTPGIAWAQQEPITADIIYFYRIDPIASNQSSATSSLKTLEKAMKNERPDDKIIYFQDLTDNQNYIAVARGSFSKKTSQSGWIKSLTNDLTSKIPGSRAFVLDSTLLTGNADLNIDATSAIVIEHVDSDPKMREMNLPLFKQLEQAMSSKPGFKGMQVWTWDNRTNHWTVIEAWDSSESQQNANRSPDIVSLWDKIYGNAAAPNNVSEYRLLTRP